MPGNSVTTSIDLRNAILKKVSIKTNWGKNQLIEVINQTTDEYLLEIYKNVEDQTAV